MTMVFRKKIITCHIDDLIGSLHKWWREVLNMITRKFSFFLQFPGCQIDHHKVVKIITTIFILAAEMNTYVIFFRNCWKWWPMVVFLQTLIDRSEFEERKSIGWLFEIQKNNEMRFLPRSAWSFANALKHWWLRYSFLRFCKYGMVWWVIFIFLSGSVTVNLRNQPICKMASQIAKCNLQIDQPFFKIT